jgi:rubrerythrin
MAIYNYDYECKGCGTRSVGVDVESMDHVEVCPLCQKDMQRIFLSAPIIRTKTITNIERGIKKDCIEMARLDDMAGRTKDKDVKREIAREIDKINNTPVTHKVSTTK